MKCGICGIAVEEQVLEIAGMKVPALCDKHRGIVNQLLSNQQKYMEARFGKETSSDQRSGREASRQIDQGSREQDSSGCIQSLLIDGCLD